MADENTPSDPGGQPATAKEVTDGGVKRLHYIYHVLTHNNQLVKVEELDEEANEVREVPLPLYVNWVEAEEERAPASGTGAANYPGGYGPYAGGYGPYGYPWQAPYGYPCWPPGMMGMWWMMCPPPPPYPPYPIPHPDFAREAPPGATTPFGARSSESSNFATVAKFNADALASGVGPVKTGVGPVKTGAGIGPVKTGIGPVKTGPLTFLQPEGIGPVKTGPPGGGTENPDESSGGGATFSPTGLK